MGSKVKLLLFLVAIGASTMRADDVTLYISGADTGTITITETGGVITGATGTFDGSSIATLLPIGGWDLNDNVYNSTQPYLYNGISFTLSTPDTNGFNLVNLYSDEGTTFCDASPGAANDYCSDQATYSDINALPDPALSTTFGTDYISTTPEPGSFLLFGSGLVGLAGMVRRKFVRLS